jgi:hypothetical protein
MISKVWLALNLRPDRNLESMKLCTMIGVEVILIIITTTEKKLLSQGQSTERGTIALKSLRIAGVEDEGADRGLPAKGAKIRTRRRAKPHFCLTYEATTRLFFSASPDQPC